MCRRTKRPALPPTLRRTKRRPRIRAMPLSVKRAFKAWATASRQSPRGEVVDAR
jgi:hypothetical protein